MNVDKTRLAWKYFNADGIELKYKLGSRRGIIRQFFQTLLAPYLNVTPGPTIAENTFHINLF